jgi:cytochrome c oxidase subunit 3
MSLFNIDLRVLSSKHFWHIVNPSPWPFFVSFGIMGLPLGIIEFFQGYSFGTQQMYYALVISVILLYVWFRDVVRESIFDGQHTGLVQKSLSISMLLFIFSEVMFFVAFFWGFFHAAIAPTAELGLQWPPVGMKNLIFSPWDIPLLNTIILVVSGITITLCHLFMKQKQLVEALGYIVGTLLLAFFFLDLQFFEYTHANFDISDGVYGSTFFLCTGFHGFHVMIGTLFILVCAIRLGLGHFSPVHHFGFEAASWYWHFVDVVWLFLYIVIYFWGCDMVYPTIHAFEI